MIKSSIGLPKSFDEWASLATGIWLLASPMVLQYEWDATATRNSGVVGVLIILAGVFTLARLRVVEEWINSMLGAWLLLSLSIIGVESSAAKMNFMFVGTTLVAADLYTLLQRTRGGPSI